MSEAMPQNQNPAEYTQQQTDAEQAYALHERVVDSASLAYLALRTRFLQRRANHWQRRSETAAQAAADARPDTADKITTARHRHGVRSRRNRMEQAGSRMERHEHRQALYQDIGNLALRRTASRSETASGQPAKVRNHTERRAAKKIEKRAEAVRQAEANVRTMDLYEKYDGMSRQDKKDSQRVIKERVKNGEVTRRQAKLDKKYVRKAPSTNTALGRKLGVAQQRFDRTLKTAKLRDAALNSRDQIQDNWHRSQEHQAKLDAMPEKIVTKRKSQQKHAEAKRLTYEDRAQQQEQVLEAKRAEIEAKKTKRVS